MAIAVARGGLYPKEDLIASPFALEPAVDLDRAEVVGPARILEPGALRDGFEIVFFGTLLISCGLVESSEPDHDLANKLVRLNPHWVSVVVDSDGLEVFWVGAWANRDTETMMLFLCRCHLFGCCGEVRNYGGERCEDKWRGGKGVEEKR